MMNLKAKKTYFNKMNELCESKIPFFFICDFLCEHIEVIPLGKLSGENIFYSNPLFINVSEDKKVFDKKLEWKKFPISKEIYAEQFHKIKTEIQNGNTYLLNLTCATKVETNYSLEELFHAGNAKYKLLYKNQFVHFSPEPFVKIVDDKIYTYPMKGTIDANLQDAGKVILENEKELNEQFTIVDLLRNDLSIVAKNVHVDDFRYIEKIQTNQKNLLSVSSKISGELRDNFKNKIGDIFASLLPAGSICGAPKAKTVEIILDTETHQRALYTGVWGIFDGKDLDSCVIIRYLEKTENGFVFKSGGGITSQSDLETEYKEMMDKVYVPIY
ncbi:aminodeoxychorismate synthase component I [Arachidicoccus ginsenosidimutans]|uniref:aminodeoxychorismate synthase component I n=1 Tax=Arachidicoccus sp. BS20 TaxID=1850526 RepID=UPI0007F0763D|nr:aminodeoxychorismate synthase component I [Arachidicoccus sp. BS20]ANI89113.1 aminodeoxychorismate synthase component I [Arachidicoccus sp. BS20]